MPDLPKPIRKYFSPKQVTRKYAAQAGRCANEKCGCDLTVSGYERDHIVRVDAGGDNSDGNLQLLCGPCHKLKSVEDNREAKKGARVRGEKGQRARREKRGGSIPSRPDAWPQGRKLQSRGFEKKVRT